MFGSKPSKEKLETQYRELLDESHRLSTSDRTKSDQKLAEANEVLKRLEQLEQQ